MGRSRKNPVRQYFSFNPTTNKSTCRIETCELQIAGNHAGNMLRHVQRNHKQYYQFLMTKKESDDESNSSQAILPTKRSGEVPLEEFVINKKRKVSLEITGELIINACTELVTVNGRPFELLEDSGFRKLINPLIKGLNDEITINIENIKQNIIKVAEIQREQLKTELKGKLILLKIDAATCHDRSVLGINVQYSNFSKEDKIIIRTLAIKEMTEKYSAVYISSIILDVLQEYDITANMIYSITTDNGANVKLLSDYQKQDSQLYDGAEYLSKEFNESNNMLEYEENTEDVQIEEQTNDLLEIEEVPQIIESNIDSNSVLQCVRCAAHTLQLAVGDSLKDGDVSFLISKARRICRTLRTPIVLNILKKVKLKKPIIDCMTQWYSTHEMLERLLELKGFCEDMSASLPELHLSTNEWTRIEMIVSALKPAKTTTNLLQSEQMTAGDFFAAWSRLKIATEKVNTPFSKNLVANMMHRETNFLECEAFLLTIFLDPRYKIILTDSQVTMAKNHLCRTFEVIKTLFGKDEQWENDEKPCLSLREEDDERDDLEILLRSRERKKSCQTNTDYPLQLQAQIDSYWEEPRLSINKCIFKYWIEKQYEYPDLYKIVTNVIAIPTTQVTVKRSFSSLKFILSPERCNLNDKILEDILFIRLNCNFS